MASKDVREGIDLTLTVMYLSALEFSSMGLSALFATGGFGIALDGSDCCPQHQTRGVMNLGLHRVVKGLGPNVLPGQILLSNIRLR